MLDVMLLQVVEVSQTIQQTLDNLRYLGHPEFSTRIPKMQGTLEEIIPIL